MSELGRPLTITGGCNCGLLRYTITLPAETTVPLTDNATCQCTLCRKFTGAIAPSLLVCKVEWCSKPLFHDSPHYKMYVTNIIPGTTGRRGFCAECGSSMGMHSKVGAEMEDFEIYTGTVDEELLAGKVVGEEEGPYGKRVKRDEGIGHILTDTSKRGHIWVENAVKGFNLKGPKLWRQDEGVQFDDVEEAKKAVR
ncbi:hypothetical protein CAC42_8165 [Sphaceloma murrayae]|uniref:CENP-V/GFA domain-containing protein n=1 Tax=Sphaceloma murrayae TaxID=2082308 RepID=A0A2K1QJ12_9PEZI|nr:hypothetical protein CAC42_8165 [Sphaceloma murrayae]